MIASLARAHPDDIDKAYDALKGAERFRIHVFMSTSPIHMEKMLRLTPDEVMKASVEGVRRARGYTDDVEFSPQDATRSDPDFMIAVCKAAVEAGATTINIPDTVGFATPTEFAELLKRVFKEVRGDREDVIMSVHCHNDLGLAVANSLASLGGGGPPDRGRHQRDRRAGRQHLDRRGGHGDQNPPGRLRGRPRGRHHPALRHLPPGGPAHRVSGAVQQGGGRSQCLCPRVRHPPARRAQGSGDLRDHGCRRRRPDRPPRSCSGSTRAGPDSSTPSTRWASPSRTKPSSRAFDRFKQLADRKIQIGEEEVRAIVEDQTGEATEKVKLVSLHVAGGNEVTPTATVRVMKDGVEQAFTGQGDGMVHAAFAALRLAFETEARLIDYRVVPVTSGADAMAEVNVVVRVGDRTFAGHALNTDVVEGSAEAFANALNKAG